MDLPRADLQAQCELGQQQLMARDYLQARRTLAAAEEQAWSAHDWDTLSRLYLPLQEARRQIRQRCGEGVVCLDLIAESAAPTLDPRQIIERFPHGQLLIAGWNTLAPALTLRRLADENHLYVETFLAAVHPQGQEIVVTILPLAASRLHSISLPLTDLPRGPRPGAAQTYAQVMALWERLHTPFLAAADAQSDPIEKMQAYRTAIHVDDACELAHQHLAATARALLLRP